MNRLSGKVLNFHASEFAILFSFDNCVRVHQKAFNQRLQRLLARITWEISSHKLCHILSKRISSQQHLVQVKNHVNFFTIYSPKKRLKSMNKGILVYFYNNSYVIPKQQSIFCIDLFSLHPLKRTSVNNTNRIINAGIFSVYASTQMNYLWRLDSEAFIFRRIRKNAFLAFIIDVILDSRCASGATLFKQARKTFHMQFFIPSFLLISLSTFRGKRLNLKARFCEATNLISSRLGVPSSVRKKA